MGGILIRPILYLDGMKLLIMRFSPGDDADNRIRDQEATP